MINLIENKKAGEKVLSIWWFFCLTFVGAGIILGVLVFYSAEMNVNYLEADILANKLADCISENGYLRNLDGFDVYRDCKLDKTFDESHFFRISFYNPTSDMKILLMKDIVGKSSGYEKECGIAKSMQKSGFFLGCTRRVVYLDMISIFGPTRIAVWITAISSQRGERVST